MLRFIHISDSHITGLDSTSKGTYSVQNDRFDLLTDAIAALPVKVDFVIHTGDLSDDESEKSYIRAFEMLKKFTAPVYFVPGNHDDPEILFDRITTLERESLPGCHDPLTYIIPNLEYDLILLNAPRSPVFPARGELPPNTIEALRKRITDDTRQKLIFLHYPPIFLDSKWLDNELSLINGDEFRKTVALSKDNILAVFFGHGHRNMQAYNNGILYSAVGSPYRQFNAWPDSSEPEMSDNEPGYFNLVSVKGSELVIKNLAVPHLLGNK